VPEGRDLLRIGLACAILFSSAWSSADPVEPEPIRAELAAVPSCAEGSSFVGQVLARTRRARQAAPNEPARTFTITIVQEGESLRGTLRVVTATREVAERKVEAKTCGEVVEALALVAALIVDPEALTTPLKPPEPEVPRTTVAAPSPWVPPIVTPPAEPAEPAAVSAGLALEVASAIAPTFTPVERVWAEVAWHYAGILHPAFGLSLARASTLVTRNSLTADILWVTGRVTACPLELVGSRRVSFRPCALFDVGVIQGKGANREGVSSADSAKTTPWVAPGVNLGLVMVPVSPLVLRLEAGGVVQTVKTSFVYQVSPSSRQEVYSIPLLGYYLGLGAGIRF
jgi:hypothetical protein